MYNLWQQSALQKGLIQPTISQEATMKKQFIKINQTSLYLVIGLLLVGVCICRWAIKLENYLVLIIGLIPFLTGFIALIYLVIKQKKLNDQKQTDTDHQENTPK